MPYNFNVKFQVGKFEVMVDTQAQYGYFEHEEHGDEYAGGLWFSDNNLVDYDGVFELPLVIYEGLHEHGFTTEG